MGQCVIDQTRIHELQVPSLALLSGFSIQHCYEWYVSHRCGSDPALLWLWHRLAAAAPI